MISRIYNRRRGVTLIEVLAAIFIMGVGLLAILVLFPVGALSMARSLREHQAAVAAATASSEAEAFNLRGDAFASQYLLNQFLPTQAQYQPYLPPNNPSSLMLIPQQPLLGQQSPLPPLLLQLSLPVGTAQPLPEQIGRGYAVYVDPFYAPLFVGAVDPPALMLNTQNPARPTVLGRVVSNGSSGLSVVTPGIRRSNVAFTPTSAAANNNNVTNLFFTTPDDITYDTDGAPAGPAGASKINPNTSLDRPGKITWCYMLRPDRASATTTFEMDVVVYQGRINRPASGETSYNVVPPVKNVADNTPGSTTIRFYNSKANGATAQGVPQYPSGPNPPSIRPGDWIVDTTYETFNTTIAPGTTVTTNGYVHGYFYKVAEIVDNGDMTSTLTLASPLRAPLYNAGTTIGVVPGNFVHMANVIDVFSRTTGRKPS
jgi:prepilin-type N-terminal cleavage/methylation domain-containing protein